MEDFFKTLLFSILKLNPHDDNFKDTASRITKSLQEILEGMENLDEKINETLSKTFPSKGYNSIILLSEIKTFSICPHHFLPVEYTIDIAYLPDEDGKLLGASKLIRLAELLSKRPVLQETLTEEIATQILHKTEALGSAVIIKGSHMCMRMRGIKSIGSKMITSTMLGTFRDNAATRQEFFELLRHSRR